MTQKNLKPKNSTKILSNEKTFEKFAIYYDEIYADKNYSKETNFINDIIKKFSKTNEKNILDIGCGTGEHDISLTRKKFQITGIDRSKTVLGIAQRKFKKNNLDAKFVKADMQNFKLDEKFDACISLFSSLSYLLKEKELKKTLKNIRNHLKPSGLLIFDFWNAEGVLKEKPSTKVKIINNKTRIIRIATPSMNINKQICAIDYHCLVLKNKTIIDEFNEIHNIKYHYLQNLKKIVKDTGFKIILVTNMDKNPPTISYYKDSWYLTIVARRI
jgi:2-polyprenyl-3-methyl-5-hydroxy-6-metoxy-1,4-benzoquinol methylase